MRRALIALALGALIFGISLLCALAFEPSTGRMFALWPGIGVRRLLRLAGISTTNQFAFWPTVLFWWLAAWLVLRFGFQRSPLLSNHTGLTCPYCAHQFTLTWSRYLKSPFGRHVCPACGRNSRLRTGLRYWFLYLPLLLSSPFVVLLVGWMAYQVAFPRHAEEHLPWFLGSPWPAVILAILFALLLPIDRAFNARFLKLR